MPYDNNDQGDYLSRQFDVTIERDEEGYYVPSVTQRIREAIELRLEVEGMPEEKLEFIGIQRITIAA